MRLTKEQWIAARTRWESDSRSGFEWLANELGVSRPAVSKMASGQGWAKKLPRSEVTPSTKVTQKVKPKVTVQVVTKVDCHDAGDALSVETEQANQPRASRAPEAPSRMPSLGQGWELVERRPVGRPSEYREEFMEMMIEFFDIEVQKIIQIQTVDRAGNPVVQDKVVINTFPTLERFGAKIGVTRETLHDWATAKNKDGTLRRPEFSYVYARARNLQGALLIEGGIAGVYEGRFAGFAAKNLINWRDQGDATAEVPMNSTSTEELDRIYREAMEQAARDKAAIAARNATQAYRRND